MQKGSLYIFPKFSTLELLNLPMLSNLFYLPGALHQKPQSHISHKTLQGKNEKIIATQPLDQRDKKRENRLLNPRSEGEGSQGGQEHCQNSSYCILVIPGQVPQTRLCQLPTHQGAQGVGEEDQLDDLQRYLVVEENHDKDEVDGQSQRISQKQLIMSYSCPSSQVALIRSLIRSPCEDILWVKML